MTPERAIADYDTVRVRKLSDSQLVENVHQYYDLHARGNEVDADWWRACVHELARRHPVILTPAEMIAEHQGIDTNGDDVPAVQVFRYGHVQPEPGAPR